MSVNKERLKRLMEMDMEGLFEELSRWHGRNNLANAHPDLQFSVAIDLINFYIENARADLEKRRVFDLSKEEIIARIQEQANIFNKNLR